LKTKEKKVEVDPEENRLFWFPFKVDEWLADRNVRLMKDYERGWYISLLVESWSDHGTVPNDPNVLWKLAGSQTKEFFEANNGAVLATFEQAEVDGKPVLVHCRMANLYIQQHKNYKQKCDAARISADKRKQDKKRQSADVEQAGQNKLPVASATVN
jgi:hypothetical protein